MQISDASNSARVLTRLTGNISMLLFQRDSIGVLSRLTRSEETPEMKLKI